MTRIWRVVIAGLDSKNIAAQTFDGVLVLAKQFREKTRKDFNDPRAEITEVSLVAEA